MIAGYLGSSDQFDDPLAQYADAYADQAEVDYENFQTDPQWKDCILFYEYFHGDNGAGLGASHQTGWTGVVAKLIELFGHLDAQHLLDAGKQLALRRTHPNAATKSSPRLRGDDRAAHN